MTEKNFAVRSGKEASSGSKVMQRKLIGTDHHPLQIPGNIFVQKKQAQKGEAAPSAVAHQIESTIGNGSGLPHKTKSFMENRFGADFSNVRIHSGDYAARLSNELNAQAFTVGNDIYFNEGKFSPESSDGKRLLAHELTHTLQQSQQINPSLIQKACHDKDNPSKTIACPEGAQDVGRQAAGQPNKRDPRADAIIATAAGPGANSDKAMQVVNDIICSYMPSQASKVSKLNFFASEPGLLTQSVGKGAGTTGNICVGNSFLTETTKSGISRRVLQVAHELEHIDQFRSGLTGKDKHPEREFLAFYHEALAEEFVGTSRMGHGTRLALIDAALGQYNCFSADLQKTHASKQKDLLTRRTAEDGKAGNASTTAPAGCVPQ